MSPSGSAAPFARTDFRRRAIELDFRNSDLAEGGVKTANAGGISTQLVTVQPDAAYDFRWTGKSHFLAFHHLRMRDGETFADDAAVVRRKDARSTFTFIPAGCRVWGWSETTGRENSFLALYLDPDTMRRELDSRLGTTETRPELFFAAPEIAASVSKLQRAMHDQVVDTLYVETLSVLIATEYCRHADGQVARAAGSGLIGHATIERVDEFIRANLGGAIALQDLANLAGLSRFHFLRAFKTSTGETPYRRVVRLRIERARELLGGPAGSVAEVARRVGYGSTSRFIEAFRRASGMTPGEFVAKTRTPASRAR